jgi:tetratricopeptide (TPR) repeat protein
MLFTAFYRSGRELVERDRLQEAVRLFDRALELRPGDTQVAHTKNLANLYMTAMGYWGADWGKTIESLSALYELDPQYKDVKERIFEAYVNHGDVLAGGGSWCQAQEAYAKALEIEEDAAVRAELEQAKGQCSGSPTVPAADGTGTPEERGPNAPSGTFVGEFAERKAIDSKKIFIRGKVLDKGGEGVVGVQVKIQAWDWSAIAVTDGQGQYAFDGLSNPVTYTLTLVDVSSLAVDVEGVPGKVSWVNFEETP